MIDIDPMFEDLSELAQQLGRYMAERCTDGLLEHYGDDLLDAFPEADHVSTQ